MKQLLTRADDLGISRAVHEGLVRSVGMMPNMPEAARGWEWVRDADIALGQHTNVCLGTPCADPALIPSLVDENGQFKSSRAYRAAAAEGEDFVNFDEAVIEIDAQLARFRQIVGAEPDYFEAHAVSSRTLMDAIHYVAEREGLREQPFPYDFSVTQQVGKTAAYMRMEDMLPPDQYDPADFVRRTVENMADGETYVLVFHPGYLDAFILGTSSLTVNRTKEVDALIDPALRAWLEAQSDLRLVDYRDL